MSKAIVTIFGDFEVTYGDYKLQFNLNELGKPSTVTAIRIKDCTEIGTIEETAFNQMIDDWFESP